MNKEGGCVARGTVTRQTSKLAQRLTEGATRAEVIDVLSRLIVDRLGREKALEVFEALDSYKEGKDGSTSTSLWRMAMQECGRPPSDSIRKWSKELSNQHDLTTVAVEAMRCYEDDSWNRESIEDRFPTTSSAPSTATRMIPKPFRAPRKSPSPLKGKKKMKYQGNDIDQALLDHAGIQQDGSVDRSKKMGKGRYVVATNGLGTNHVGDSSKVVETAAEKKQYLETWIDRPISMSLVGLALVFGKTMPKHFFLNALQTVHIIKEEFGYTFDEFMGLRWLSITASPKGPKGILVQYERSIDCVDLHLRRLKSTNTGYLQLSSLIAGLYEAMSNPEHNKLYQACGNSWMVQYISERGFKDKVNGFTEYIHLAYLTIRYTFFHKFPEIDVSELMRRIFKTCRDKRSMAAGLFDLCCRYPDLDSVVNDSRLNFFVQNPETCLDEIRTGNGHNVHDLAEILLAELKDLLNKSHNLNGGSLTTIIHSNYKSVTAAQVWLMIRYRICVNWLGCGNRGDVKKPFAASIALNGTSDDPYRELSPLEIERLGEELSAIEREEERFQLNTEQWGNTDQKGDDTDGTSTYSTKDNSTTMDYSDSESDDVSSCSSYHSVPPPLYQDTASPSPELPNGNESDYCNSQIDNDQRFNNLEAVEQCNNTMETTHRRSTRVNKCPPLPPGGWGLLPTNTEQTTAQHSTRKRAMESSPNQKSMGIAESTNCTGNRKKARRKKARASQSPHTDDTAKGYSTMNPPKLTATEPVVLATRPTQAAIKPLTPRQEADSDRMVLRGVEQVHVLHPFIDSMITKIHLPCTTAPEGCHTLVPALPLAPSPTRDMCIPGNTTSPNVSNRTMVQANVPLLQQLSEVNKTMKICNVSALRRLFLRL
ncbi:hypothetical protein G9A89_002954 [Geosiphon pyriformis]|nr:hypothetical protein G9A89_002954 [Geosiphon pyriformis]